MTTFGNPSAELLDRLTAERAGYLDYLIPTAAHTGAAADVVFAPSYGNGSWTQIISSLSNRASEFIVLVGNRSSGNTANAAFEYEVGLGSSGNEISISGRIRSPRLSDKATVHGFPIRHRIPSGSRLSVRGGFNNTATGYGLNFRLIVG